MIKGQLLQRILILALSLFVVILAHYSDIFDSMIILVVPVVYYAYREGYVGGIISASPVLLYFTYYYFFYLDDPASFTNISRFIFKLIDFAIIIGVAGKMHAKYDKKMKEQVRTTDSLSEILDLLDEKVMISDQNTDEIIFANKQMREQHNLSSDYIGVPCYKALYDKDERCEFCNLYSEHREGADERYYWEHHDPVHNKCYRDINTIVPWPDGRFVRLQQTIDITESRLAEARLNRRVELQRALQHIAQLFISSTDFDKLIQEALKILAQSLGVDRITVVRSCGDDNCLVYGCYDEKNPFAHGDNKDKYIRLDIFFKFFSQNSQRFALSSDFEEGFVLTNVENQAMHDFCVAPIHTSGDLWGYVVAMNYDSEMPKDDDALFVLEMFAKLVNDLVLRTRSEIAAAESSARVEAMINAMPTSSMFYDRDGLPIFCNNYTTVLFGLPSTESYLEHYLELMPKTQPDGRDSGALQQQLIAETFASGESITFEWMHSRLSGEEFPTEVTLVRINWTDGTYRVVAYVRSLELLKKQMVEIEQTNQMLTLAKEAAEESSRAKADFLAKMSHEIRTPLNAIFSMSHLLSIAEQDPVKQGYLQNVLLASDSLLSIINDILDFSKIDANKIHVVMDEYSPFDCVCDAIKLNAVKVIPKDILVMTKIAPSLPMRLYGDENKIKQIITNFMSNAIKYTHKGSICIGVEHEISDAICTLRISVEDTGIGIAPEDLDMLWQAFYQADRRTNKNIQGTGLGLSICRGLADAIGGKIELESEYGKGSKFTLVLPQAIVDAAPLVAPFDAQDKKVLILGTGELAQNLSEVMQSLNVPHEVGDPCAKYEAEIRNKTYTHIFYGHEDSVDFPTWLGDDSSNVSITMIKKFSNLSDDYMRKRINILFPPVMITDVVQIIRTGTVRIRSTIAGQDMQNTFRFKDVTALIVDDNETNLISAAELLKKYGIQPEMAESGEVALEMAARKNYNLIFMDHMMLGMDGVEATGKIRKLNSWNATVPIVALTANALVGLREYFLENKFDDFLSKPIMIAELEDILLKWLPSKHRISEHDEAPQGSADEEALAIIKNFDGSKHISRHVAMERARLSPSSYVKLVRSLHRSIPDYIARLNLFRDGSENLRWFQITIHAQKSAFANIGADVLSARAAALEQAAAAEDLRFVNEMLPEYMAALHELEQLLDDTLGSGACPEGSENKDKRDIKTVSAELLQAKELILQLEHSMALEKLNAIVAFSYEAHADELLQQLIAAAQNYDIDKAVDLIDALVPVEQ